MGQTDHDQFQHRINEGQRYPSDTSGRYLSFLSKMSGDSIPDHVMEEYLLGNFTPLNESQYLEELVSTIARRGYTSSPKNRYSCDNYEQTDNTSTE